MAVVAFIALFLAIGIGVAFVAFSGGPAEARQAYLSGGRRAFKIIIPILYIGLGIAVPALVIVNRHSAEGASGTLATTKGNAKFNQGKTLFRESCWSCHTLKAIGSQGITGPNLTHVYTRQAFAGDTLDMNPENLRLWLTNPPKEKPGSIMPNLGLSNDEITALVAYLQTLR